MRRRDKNVRQLKFPLAEPSEGLRRQLPLFVSAGKRILNDVLAK